MVSQREQMYTADSLFENFETKQIGKKLGIFLYNDVGMTWRPRVS
jgi:hypothetical protein